MMALAEKWGYPEGLPFPWWLVKEAGYSDEEIAEMQRIIDEHGRGVTNSQSRFTTT